jgi:hypothetical protein
MLVVGGWMQGTRGRRRCCRGWFPGGALRGRPLRRRQLRAGRRRLPVHLPRGHAVHARGRRLQGNFGETDGGPRNHSEVAVAEAEAVQTTQVGPEQSFVHKQSFEF